MEEIERMMTERRRYKRRRGGAWAQVSHETAEIGPDGRPPWCAGCAWWNAMVRGCCEVFSSCLDCWREEGDCQAWADAERRAEVERAIEEYTRRSLQPN